MPINQSEMQRLTSGNCLMLSIFTGVSFLEGKDDIFEDWREKFFNTYKVGLS